MKWKDIVKIQYDAWQRTSALFTAILAGLVTFAKSKELPLKCWTTTLICLTFFFILLQNITVLYITDIQRRSLWKKEHGQDATEENNRENRLRDLILKISIGASLFVLLTLGALLVE